MLFSDHNHHKHLDLSQADIPITEKVDSGNLGAWNYYELSILQKL
jgi:hypothetical protein